MNKASRLLVFAHFMLGFFITGRLTAAVVYDATVPQLVFAAQEIGAALKEAGKENVLVTLTITPNAASPEGYEIKTNGLTQIQVIGTDASGAMYGGLEVADLTKIGLPIKNKTARPFIEKRGIKFNIPWDARAPSYDDTGDSAQLNIATVWDFEFWKAYIDDLARDRYNVLSLWSTFPYAHLVKLDAYPDAVMNDVYRIKDGLLKPENKRDLFKDFDTNGDGAISPEDGVLELVKIISIDEKIALWKRIFQYANDRGIEIYLFSWNVFTHGATGKYGITQDQTNPKTIEYVRQCVRQALLTYPQIAGIGVCSGENDRRELDGTADSCENYIYKTYAEGIMDVQKVQPDRKVRFIFRTHSSKAEWVHDAFKNYTGGILDCSVKYSVAHVYSSRRPQEWEDRVVNEGWNKYYKAFLNLRNDDIFMHRWGSPDFVREFIKWMPRAESPGFYIGSDGYVWAREFISKNPAVAGQLENVKHWYQFRLWGQLSYDNSLGDDYWQAMLQHRFPGVDAKLLFNAWQTVSEIVPQLNRASWADTDADFAPEGCMNLFSKNNFLTVEDYYFAREPMVLNTIANAPDPQCISVTKWAKASLAGNAGKLKGLTPLQVADNLDRYAQAADDALPKLRSQIGKNEELRETLLDIESMAQLGRYYAEKQRGAAQLALFRAGNRQDLRVHAESVAHFEAAVGHWKAYAAVLDSHYRPSLMARTGYMDWDKTLKLVEGEVVTVRKEGEVSKIAFVKLKDGDSFPVGADLRIAVNASNPNGLYAVKLYVNGLLMTPEKTNDTYVWSAASDQKLSKLPEKYYRIEAVAIDKNKFEASQVVTIKVGKPKAGTQNDWKNEVYQVLLDEGGILKSDGKEKISINLDRLECSFTLTNNGKLILLNKAANKTIWQANSKVPEGKCHAEFKNGSLTTYTGWPGGSEVHKIWTSKKPKDSDQGPFKFGVTKGKKVVCFWEKNGEVIIVWSYGLLPSNE